MTTTRDWSRMLDDRLARVAQDARLTKEFLLKEAVGGGGSFMPDDASMRRGFLADILAHPEDDTPRLIFADWLDDHGDPPRGEFIRVQCELALDEQVRSDVATWPADLLVQWQDRNAAFRRREAELLAAAPGDWFPFPEGVAEDAVSYQFRRGFVEEITCTSSDWLAHADTLCAAAPIRRVLLTTWPDVRGSRGEAHLHGRHPVLVEPPGEDVAQRLLLRHWPGIIIDLPLSSRLIDAAAATPVSSWN